MRKILFLFLMMLMVVGCDERFMSWKEYNEYWIVEQKDKLGLDENVIEVEVLPSGILIEKEQVVLDAINREDLKLVERLISEPWVALVVEK